MSKIILDLKEADIIYTWYMKCVDRGQMKDEEEELEDKILTYIAEETRKEIKKRDGNKRNTNRFNRRTRVGYKGIHKCRGNG